MPFMGGTSFPPTHGDVGIIVLRIYVVYTLGLINLLRSSNLRRMDLVQSSLDDSEEYVFQWFLVGFVNGLVLESDAWNGIIDDIVPVLEYSSFGYANK